MRPETGIRTPSVRDLWRAKGRRQLLGTAPLGAPRVQKRFLQAEGGEDTGCGTVSLIRRALAGDNEGRYVLVLTDSLSSASLLFQLVPPGTQVHGHRPGAGEWV